MRPDPGHVSTPDRSAIRISHASSGFENNQKLRRLMQLYHSRHAQHDEIRLRFWNTVAMCNTVLQQKGKAADPGSKA